MCRDLVCLALACLTDGATVLLLLLLLMLLLLSLLQDADGFASAFGAHVDGNVAPSDETIISMVAASLH